MTKAILKAGQPKKIQHKKDRPARRSFFSPQLHGTMCRVRLTDYLEKKTAEKNLERPLHHCASCLSPQLTCYCHLIRRFDPGIRFAILTHWREAQKRIATGRISHLCLENSFLLCGYDYSEDPRVNALLADKRFHPVVLYPGEHSVNVSTLSAEQKTALTPHDKELLVLVIDGTWITARKTMQRSRNLQCLPRISFDPAGPSRFRVRKQPKPEYYSTVEAIHQTIELLGPARGFNIETRAHDVLLKVFDHMVEQQLAFSVTRQRSHRGVRTRSLPPKK